jgi:hypothetical protein
VPSTALTQPAFCPLLSQTVPILFIVFVPELPSVLHPKLPSFPYFSVTLQSFQP